MKLHYKITATIVIVFLAISTWLDLATTEFLLNVNIAQVGNQLIQYTELNPMFYILGHPAFVALVIAATVVFSAFIIYADSYCYNHPKYGRRTFIYYSAIVSILGVVHYGLGMNQLVMIFKLLNLTQLAQVSFFLIFVPMVGVVSVSIMIKECIGLYKKHCAE
jgi:hypothetical protein